MKAPISKVVVTNTIPLGPKAEAMKPKLVQLCIGSLLGDAIGRIHNNQSVSELFKKGAGPKR